MRDYKQKENTVSTTTTVNHRITREGDEYVCTCGLRWDIDEDDPHEEVTSPQHNAIRVVTRLNKALRKKNVSE